MLRRARPFVGTALQMIHTESDVWKAAMALVIDVYRVTPSLPKDERFGLVAQMRRAAVSIPSNIAEGAGRETDREKRRFLWNARGSLNELATQVDICEQLNYLRSVEATRLQATIGRVRQLLAGTIRSLSSRITDNG